MQKVNVLRLRLGIGFILTAAALHFAGCNALKLGQSTDDKTITTQIQAKLFDDSVLKTRDIHVTSDKGTVTLTGTVGTDPREIGRGAHCWPGGGREERRQPTRGVFRA